jgi:hypothetical protein
MSDIKVQFGLYLFIMAKTHRIIQLTNRSENKPLASIWLKCMHAFILVFLAAILYFAERVMVWSL